MKPTHTILAALAAPCAAPVPLAHEFWVEPQKFQAETGGAVLAGPRTARGGAAIPFAAGTVYLPDEEKTSICGGVGTYAEQEVPTFHSENDRVIHMWQTYAGGYSEKTIDKHLAAIRFFERHLEGKPFAKLTNDDFAKVRDELKRHATAQAAESMSASTIKHTVSHIVAFFDWFLKQDG